MSCVLKESVPNHRYLTILSHPCQSSTIGAVMNHESREAKSHLPIRAMLTAGLSAVLFAFGTSVPAHAASLGVAGNGVSCGATGTRLTNGARVTSGTCAFVQAHVSALIGTQVQRFNGPRHASTSTVTTTGTNLSRSGTIWIGSLSATRAF